MPQQVNNEQIINVSLNRDEMRYIREVCERMEVPYDPSWVMRQALRTYQLLEAGILVKVPTRKTNDDNKTISD